MVDLRLAFNRDNATMDYMEEKRMPIASSEHPDSEDVVNWTLVTLECCGNVEENPGPGSESWVS